MLFGTLISLPERIKGSSSLFLSSADFRSVVVANPVYPISIGCRSFDYRSVKPKLKLNRYAFGA
jgi:hypothetical protein